MVITHRQKSPSKMPTGNNANVGGLPLYPRCSCCPFGYHIDLDFVNYCQSLGKEAPSPGQKMRRDRRRQRQSMEIMLGCVPVLDTLHVLPQVGEVSALSRRGDDSVSLAYFDSTELNEKKTISDY